LRYIETWSPQGSILGPIFFINYINYLPKGISSLSEPIKFADDTSVIITNRHFEDLSSVSDLVLSRMVGWFELNKLVQNLEKTNIMKFLTINSPFYDLTTGYKDTYIKERLYTKFLGCNMMAI